MTKSKIESVFLGTLLTAALAFTGTSSQAQEASEVLINDFSRSERFELMLTKLADAPSLSAVERREFAFPLAFAFPHDAKYRNALTETEPRSNQIFGIDLSHYNAENCRCEIDWVKLRHQDVQYAYLKVSQGSKSFDSFYTKYRTDAKSVAAADRIPIGGYHFLSADTPPEAQAANFISRVGSIEPGDLPPVVDLEWDVRRANGRVVLDSSGRARDFWDALPGDEIIRRVVAFAKAVEATTGRAPIVYTSPTWWKERIGDGGKIAALGKYAVWTSDYSRDGRKLEKPGVPGDAPWALWQFTSTARLTSGGIGTGQSVDANVFNGTPQQFRSAMGLKP